MVSFNNFEIFKFVDVVFKFPFLNNFNRNYF